jgi:hypothetical protein
VLFRRDFLLKRFVTRLLRRIMSMKMMRRRMKMMMPKVKPMMAPMLSPGESGDVGTKTAGNSPGSSAEEEEVEIGEDEAVDAGSSGNTGWYPERESLGWSFGEVWWFLVIYCP